MTDAPIGVAEGISLSFFDLVDTGAVNTDYITVMGNVMGPMLSAPYGTAVDYSTPPPDAAPALDLSAYTGTYANSYFGDATVEADAEGLVLRLGPEQTAYPTRHFDRDVFLYQPVGENAFGESAVTFTVEGDDDARDRDQAEEGEQALPVFGNKLCRGGLPSPIFAHHLGQIEG